MLPMCTSWPAGWNKQCTLLPLVAHASSSPSLSVNCFDLFVYFLLRNLRTCCTKNVFWITAPSKHWLNLFRYSKSIFPAYSYACLIALDKAGLCLKLTLFYLYGSIVLCRHMKNHMNVFNKKLNPYQTKSTHPWSASTAQLPFQKTFRSSPASHSTISYNSEHQALPATTPACSQLQQTGRASYFKWVVFTVQPSLVGCINWWLIQGQSQVDH